MVLDCDHCKEKDLEIKQLKLKIKELKIKKDIYEDIDISNIKPLTADWVRDVTKDISIDDIDDVSIFASYIVTNLMTDVYVTDRAKKLVLYVDEDGNLVKNCTMERFLTILLEPVKEKIRKIVEDADVLYENKINSCKDEYMFNVYAGKRIRLWKSYCMASIADGKSLTDDCVKIRTKMMNIISRTAKGKEQLFAL